MNAHTDTTRTDGMTDAAFLATVRDAHREATALATYAVPTATAREILATVTYLATTTRGRRIARTILAGGVRHTLASIRDPYLLG